MSTSFSSFLGLGFRPKQPQRPWELLRPFRSLHRRYSRSPFRSLSAWSMSFSHIQASSSPSGFTGNSWSTPNLEATEIGCSITGNPKSSLWLTFSELLKTNGAPICLPAARLYNGGFPSTITLTPLSILSVFHTKTLPTEGIYEL